MHESESVEIHCDDSSLSLVCQICCGLRLQLIFSKSELLSYLSIIFMCLLFQGFVYATHASVEIHV